MKKKAKNLKKGNFEVLTTSHLSKIKGGTTPGGDYGHSGGGSTRT
jgi:hypothetical protein